MRSKVLVLAAAIGALAAGTAVGASADSGSTDPNQITFGVPYVTDPIHTYGEPDVGVDRAGDMFVSGPAGTGTQRSLWEASYDGGQTFRQISPGPAPDAVQGTNAPPGGGDTDIAFDNQTPQKQYFMDLYALTCLRVATTTDAGKTTQQGYRGCGNSLPEVDRQWYAIYDPPAGTTATSAYTGPKPLIYIEFGPAPSTWVKSNDGINFTAADNGNGHFGADGYPSIDQVTGKVFEANYSGNTIKLNIGTPDASGNLTFLDDSGQGGLITVANNVINSGDVANFVATSMDSARNLYVTWVSRSGTPMQRQTWVAASSAASGWRTWTAPIQVSDGSTVTGDAVNVFPWIKAGGPGRADAVWYGDKSTLDPSKNAAGHEWNVFMSQLVFPTDDAGAITGAAPSLQLVKVTPHPMDYLDVCLSGTGCIESQGNRNLADFFVITTDAQGRAQIVYDDMSNGLIQAGSNNAADHAGAGIVTIAHQNGGPGLFGHPVTGPTAQPLSGQSDGSGDARYPVIGGANQPALDLTNSKLVLANGNLTVTMKVADLTQLSQAAQATHGALQEYVTRWQVGKTLYYAEASMAGSSSTAQFSAGKVGSIDLCSVSACDPHILVYPEAGGGTTAESGSVSCPASPSAASPCTITITVPAADVGAPTSDSLFESVGAYAFTTSHPQASTTTAQAQADNVPLEIDGICCYNFTSNAPSTDVPELPWPALGAGLAVVMALGVTRRRRRKTAA